MDNIDFRKTGDSDKKINGIYHHSSSVVKFVGSLEHRIETLLAVIPALRYKFNSS